MPVTMDINSTQAREILRIIEAAGDRGVTRKEISNAVRDKGCDCENWINTLLEAGVIEKCGKRDKADLYRIAK
jgi:chromosome segregation and condensation protein ScpB